MYSSQSTFAYLYHLFKSYYNHTFSSKQHTLCRYNTYLSGKHLTATGTSQRSRRIRKARHSTGPGLSPLSPRMSRRAAGRGSLTRDGRSLRPDVPSAGGFSLTRSRVPAHCARPDATSRRHCDSASWRPPSQSEPRPARGAGDRQLVPGPAASAVTRSLRGRPSSCVRLTSDAGRRRPFR